MSDTEKTREYGEEQLREYIRKYTECTCNEGMCTASLCGGRWMMLNNGDVRLMKSATRMCLQRTFCLQKRDRRTDKNNK